MVFFVDVLKQKGKKVNTLLGFEVDFGEIRIILHQVK